MMRLKLNTWAQERAQTFIERTPVEQLRIKNPPQEDQAKGLVLPSQPPDLRESHRTERVWS